MTRQIVHTRFKSNRVEYIDVLRGIAIVLMIFGHCIQYGSGNLFLSKNQFYDNGLFKLIYSFHMPLFAFISGYCLYYSIEKKYHANVFIKKKFKSLLLPMISWGTIYWIIYSFNFNYFAALNVLWYLPGTFVASLIIYYIEKYLSHYKLINYIFYLVFIAILFFIPNVIATWGYLFPYILLGFYCNKLNIISLFKKENKHFKYITFIILILLYVFLFNHFSYNCYIYTSGINIINSNIGILKQSVINIYRWVIGIIPIILLFLIYIEKENLKKKKSNIIERIIKIIGKESIGFYVINAILYNKILSIITYNFKPNIIFWFLETIVCIIITYIIVIIVNKTKYIKLVLFGK